MDDYRAPLGPPRPYNRLLKSMLGPIPPRPNSLLSPVARALAAPLPMPPVRVINVPGTAYLTCPCGSWLDHSWREVGYPSAGCLALYCNNPAEVGAHVRIAGPVDLAMYIAPLCHSCNKRAGTFEIRSSYPLVPAYASPWCRG